jgi:hypothetical protein
MKKTFLLLFTPANHGSESVFSFLDSKSEISDWHSPFPNGAFVVSDLDSDRLRDMLREGMGSEWFIVTELRFDERGTSLSGLLPTASWDFLGRHSEENWPQRHKQPA